MDWLFLFWWPWFNIYFDVFLIQFFFLFTLYLIYSNNNVYLNLFYIFIFFLYCGLFISFYNLEVFTAFLWLTECVVIFVSIILLFYLNVYGNLFKTNVNVFSLKFYFVFFFFAIIYFNYNFLSSYEDSNHFNFFIYFDDYYEAFNNNKFNDLYPLYLSYYHINSFEFLIIGFVLLIGSLLCVNINKFSKNLKTSNYYNLLTIFDFFNDFVKFFFIRKQNVTKQGNVTPGTKIFKKKVSK